MFIWAYLENRFGIGARARPTGYSIQDFIGEWNQSIQAIEQNSAVTNQKVLLGPSTCCNIDQKWSIDQVIAAGYMTTFSNQLKQLTVQYYPNGESRFSNVLRIKWANKCCRQLRRRRPSSCTDYLLRIPDAYYGDKLCEAVFKCVGCAEQGFIK